MNSELYMMLQAGPEPCTAGHIWIIGRPLFECYMFKRISLGGSGPSTRLAHTSRRKSCVGTSLTYRSVMMYLQGLIDLTYNEVLCGIVNLFKDLYEKGYGIFFVFISRVLLK